jgi:alkylation response protein AidB-like acyl-CoA dehydrogenase
VGGGSSSDLGELAKGYVGVEASGRLADLDLRQRITRNKMDFQALRQTIARTAAESRAANGPSAATSIIKYQAAESAKERSELMVEAMGSQGLGWDGEGFTPTELAAVHGWLRAKANSIEGGTSEINLNVVSKRVLGLPDPK